MNIKTETKEFTCSVCGKPSQHEVIAESPAPAGSPDLDLRPAEPHRSFIKYWVTECPHCGYCETMLDMPIDFERSYLETEEYKSCAGKTAAQGLTAQFIRQALVRTRNHNYPAALQSYVYAAWSCDDEGNAELAKECRLSAVRLMNEHKSAFDEHPDLSVLKADLLRRSGEFAAVISDYSDWKSPSQLMNAIVGYEVELAKKQDDTVHLAGDVPNVMIK